MEQQLAGRWLSSCRDLECSGFQQQLTLSRFRFHIDLNDCLSFNSRSELVTQRKTGELHTLCE